MKAASSSWRTMQADTHPINTSFILSCCIRSRSLDSRLHPRLASNNAACCIPLSTQCAPHHMPGSVTCLPIANKANHGLNISSSWSRPAYTVTKLPALQLGQYLTEAPYHRRCISLKNWQTLAAAEASATIHLQRLS